MYLHFIYIKFFKIKFFFRTKLNYALRTKILFPKNTFNHPNHFLFYGLIFLFFPYQPDFQISRMGSLPPTPDNRGSSVTAWNFNFLKNQLNMHKWIKIVIKKNLKNFNNNSSRDSYAWLVFHNSDLINLFINFIFQ